jgi:hypothetical protein
MEILHANISDDSHQRSPHTWDAHVRIIVISDIFAMLALYLSCLVPNIQGIHKEQVPK